MLRSSRSATPFGEGEPPASAGIVVVLTLLRSNDVTKVRLAYRFVAQDVVGRSRRDHRAEIEDIEAGDEALHHLHVVFDEQDCELVVALHGGEALGERRRLLDVEPR